MVTEAIEKHIADYNLGPILDDVAVSIETKSDDIMKVLWGAEVIFTDAILTPRWLLWAIRDGKSSVTALSARLADIVVVDYSKSDLAKLIPDTGIDVTGVLTGGARGSSGEQAASIFIGLESSAAGKKFLELLI